MYQPKLTVKTAAELKAILGKDFPSQVAKVIDHIDPHCRTWIERCPFVVISSTNAAGAMDVSPKGDPPGFVKVLDKQTLAVPDRMGNHRGDTFLELETILLEIQAWACCSSYRSVGKSCVSAERRK